MSVPIATSPGRAGFGPQLSLCYDSGSGNGPFGFGWRSLCRRSRARRTRACRATYDAIESDVFVLSGAEDLVPVLARGRPAASEDRAQRTEPGYRDPPLSAADRRTVRTHRTLDARGRRRHPLALDLPRQRPHASTARTSGAAIADPADPTRIFSWLICETPRRQGQRHRLRLQGRRRRRASTWPRRTSAIAARDDPRATSIATSSAFATAIARRMLDASATGRARPRADRATDGCSRSSSTTAITIRSLRARRGTEPWTRAQRPVLQLPRRIRGAHLPAAAGACSCSITFRAKPSVGHDCLVRSTDFTYAPTS